MSEFDTSNPNAEGTPEDLEELTTGEIMEMLREYREQGVDFEDEDAEFVGGMPPDEAMEYYIIAMESAGLDAEGVLREKRLAKIEDNPDEVKRLQNMGEGSYSSQQADQLLDDGQL